MNRNLSSGSQSARHESGQTRNIVVASESGTKQRRSCRFFPDHRGLQQQIHGLAHSQKIPARLRIGHGERSSAGDLPCKRLCHTTARSQHVRQPQRRATSGKHHLFSDSLRRSQH